MISAFLDHLETDRHNSARSRNTRLAAVRSLFRYAALRHPEHAELIAAGAGHPAEALRQDDRVVPGTRRSRRPARRARPGPVGRPARPCPADRWPCRPGCDCPSSPDSTAATSSSAPGRTSAARGKGRKQRCVPLTSATTGDPAGLAHRNEAGSATNPLSRLGPGAASATTPSKRGSRSTNPLPDSDVHRLPPRSSPPTRFGTPAR